MNSVRCGILSASFLWSRTGWTYHHKYDDRMKENSRNLGVAGASEGVSLPPCAQVSLLVVLVGPHLVPPVLHVLTRCPDSSGLPHLLALKSIRSLWGECDSIDSVRASNPTSMALITTLLAKHQYPGQKPTTFNIPKFSIFWDARVSEDFLWSRDLVWRSLCGVCAVQSWTRHRHFRSASWREDD